VFIIDVLDRLNVLWVVGEGDWNGPVVALQPPAGGAGGGPPPPEAHIDFDAYSANGTPGIVRGSGFADPDCNVTVSKAGLLGPYTATGNINTGIPVMTPCVNTGQTITITVTSGNQNVTIKPQCPNAP
jgi:hypothetical protein